MHKELSKINKIEGGRRLKGFLNNDVSEKPIISIITPVFNNERFLEGTILSVINQTYENIEYIVVDGGSTDGTIDIIKKYDEALSYWVSEPDNGIYDAQDKGIKLSSGKYFAILNSDDWYFDNNVIKKIVDEIIKSQSPDFVYGNVNIIKNTGNIIKFSSSIDQLKSYNSIPHPTLFLKRNIYHQLGGFNLKYKISADYDLIIKLYQNKFRFTKIDHTFVNIRQGGESYRNKNTIRENFEIRKDNRLLNPFINYYKYVTANIKYKLYNWVEIFLPKKFIVNMRKNFYKTKNEP